MNKKIISHVVLFGILILTFAAVGTAEDKMNERGFGATLTSKGFGLRLIYNWSRGPASMLTSEFEFINVKGKK